MVISCQVSCHRQLEDNIAGLTCKNNTDLFWSLDFPKQLAALSRQTEMDAQTSAETMITENSCTIITKTN